MAVVEMAGSEPRGVAEKVDADVGATVRRIQRKRPKHDMRRHGTGLACAELQEAIP
jgi:hypothetical protein